MHVVDKTGVLNKEEIKKINKKLESIKKESNEYVLVLVTDDFEGKTIEEYADDYFDEKHMGKDGIVLVVSPKKRKWRLSTSGKAIYYFTDKGQEFLMEDVIKNLSKEKYSEAFMEYANWCEIYIEEGEKGEPFDEGHLPKKKPGLFWFFIDLLIGIAVFMVLAFIKLSKMTSVKSNEVAKEYVDLGSAKLVVNSDKFIRRSVTTRQIESSSSGGGSTTNDSGTHGGSGGSF